MPPKVAPITAVDLKPLTKDLVTLHHLARNAPPTTTTTTENQPYKLTFFIENDDSKGLQLTNFDGHLKPEQYYDDLVVESYENPSSDRTRHPRHVSHKTDCILSGFVYFMAITTVVYLAIMWTKRQMHIRLERFEWW